MPDRLERSAPLVFVLLGAAMIVTAAAAGLSEALAIAFAVLGVALVCLGGFASRLAPGEPFEIGPSGLKAVLSDFKYVAEQRNEPEAAKALGEYAEAVDADWFLDYLRRAYELADASPYTRAAILEEEFKKHATRMREEGLPPGVP